MQICHIEAVFQNPTVCMERFEVPKGRQLNYAAQFLKGHCKEGKSIVHNAISAVEKYEKKSLT